VTGEDVKRPEWMPDSERGVERLKKGGEVIGAIIDDPGKIIDAVVDPIKEDWAAGRKGEAVGRATAEVAGIVLGGKGIDKVAKGGKVADAVGDVARVGDDVADAAKKVDIVGDVGRVDGGGVKAASDTDTIAIGGVVTSNNAVLRVDYSRGFERDLSNFKPGHQLINGPIDNDLVLVSYHTDVPLGQNRSAKWWTTNEQANVMPTIDDVHQGLALPREWGSRDAVTVVRIPKGTDITAYKGQASPQLSKTGQLFNGDAVQYRFKNFDPSWIIETRSLNK